MKKTLAGTLLLGMLMWLGGCATPYFEPPLRVGTSPTLRPIVFEQAGELRGLEVDLADEIGARMGRRIEWVTMPFVDLLPALERGDLDLVMAGVSVTEERARRVRFVTPYMESGLMAMMRKADLGRLNSRDAVYQQGRRIGVEQGSVAEDWVAKRLPEALVTFSSSDQMVLALRRQEVDYVVMDAPAVWHLTSSPEADDLLGYYQFLTREPLAWAVAVDQPGFQQQLDELLKAMHDDGSLRSLVRKWVPVRMEVNYPD